MNYCFRYGAISLLITLPEYRRKGYAQMLVDVISRKYVATTDGSPYGFVHVDNTASQSLFKRMGFKTTHKIDFIIYEPKK